MRQYLVALLSFTAVIVGVLSHSVDSHQPIAPLGWAAAVVGAASFLIAVVGAYRDQKRLDGQASQRAKVQLAAKLELRRAVMQLLAPFVILCENISNKTKAFEFRWEPFHTDAEYMRDRLLNSSFLEGWKLIDLRKHPDSPDTFPSYVWWDYFSSMANEADAKLDATVGKYGGYFEPSELLLIHGLQSDPFFAMRLKQLKILVDANERAPTYPVAWAFTGPDEGHEYARFVDRVCSLVAILPVPQRP